MPRRTPTQRLSPLAVIWKRIAGNVRIGSPGESLSSLNKFTRLLRNGAKGEANVVKKVNGLVQREVFCAVFHSLTSHSAQGEIDRSLDPMAITKVHTMDNKTKHIS